MSKVVTAVVVGLALLIGAGMLLPLYSDLRHKSAVVGCRENLRQIGLFAAHHADPKAVPDLNPDRPFPAAIPAGTLVLPNTPPDARLGWLVNALPWLDQKRQPTDTLLAEIDRKQPWEANRGSGATAVKAYLCPGNPPAGGRPFALTQYVGVAGLGADAATLPIVPTTFNAGVFGRFTMDTVDPRAGCFRYDAPTPFALITDGLGQTVLVAETSTELGPWLRGGTATVRGLDPAGPPYLGAGGQFGGNHPGVANWAFADGSVRPLTDRTDRGVLERLFTIAGGAAPDAEW